MVSGSKILQGYGTMLVLAVGVHSQNRKLQLKLEHGDEEIPLRVKLSGFAEKIGKIVMVTAIITFPGQLHGI